MLLQEDIHVDEAGGAVTEGWVARRPRIRGDCVHLDGGHRLGAEQDCKSGLAARCENTRRSADVLF